MRRAGVLISSLVVYALSGCTGELLHGLDERQANEVVAALGERGIAADKSADDRLERYKVQVPRAEQAAAVRVLEERELPRHGGSGVGEAFAEAGLLPSAAAERARLGSALAIDTERSLEAIPGVASARVLLALPSAEPLRLDGPKPRATAAVLLRVRGVPALADGQIKQLVASGVEGLQPEDVLLALVPEPVPPAAVSPTLVRLGPLWVTPRGAALAILLLAACVIALGAAVLALRGRDPNG